MPSSSSPSAIVVGAGVFGASIAHRLAREDWKVTLVDREPPPHRLAESAGESRLMRFSHGEDVWYTRSAWRARELWRDLEDESGRELLVASGLAWFARSEQGWEADSERILAAHGIAAERLDLDAASALFPSLRTDDLAFVLFEPEAGVLRAAEAVRTLVAQAETSGVRLETGVAHADGADVLVDGRRLSADRVVWACGAWLAKLFPELIDLRVTKQETHFFAAPPGWHTPPVPAWVDYDGAAYGLAALDDHGVKVALDHEGPSIDPDHEPRQLSAAGERRARAYTQHRFPALAGAPLAAATVCHYGITADSSFVAAPHPEHEQVWLVGGGSGHGFKHGPALAEHVAAVLAGRAEPEPRLALGQRRPSRSLRTAGSGA